MTTSVPFAPMETMLSALIGIFGMFIGFFTIVFAIAAWYRNRRMSQVFLVMLSGFGVVLLLNPTLLNMVSSSVVSVVNESTAPSSVASVSPSPSDVASSTVSVSPSTAPTATSAPAVTSEFHFPWATALWVILGVAILSMLVAFAVFVIPQASSRGKLAAKKVEDARAEREALKKKREDDLVAWAKLQDSVKEMGARLMGYRLDMDAILSFPLLVDVTNPVTGEAYRQMSRAEAMAAEKCPPLPTGTSVTETPFADAVSQFSVALRAAEDNARRIGLRNLDLKQRESMRRAQRLWALAKDDAATAPERASAWERLQETVEGVVSIPAEAMKAVEGAIGMRALEPASV